jgi:hypothetical protein
VSPTANRTEATTRSRVDRPATIRTPACTRPGGCAVCFLRPLVAGPFVEKSSGAKFRVFFGHDTRIYTETISRQGCWYVPLQQSVTCFQPIDSSNRPTTIGAWGMGHRGSGGSSQTKTRHLEIASSACQNPKDRPAFGGLSSCKKLVTK